AVRLSDGSGTGTTRSGSNAGATAGVSTSTAVGANVVVSSSNAVVLGRSADTVQIPGALNVTGTFNVPGSTNYSGTLSANILNAATQLNLGGNRVLSVSGIGGSLNSNTFVGDGAGSSTTPDSSGNGSSNSFF